MVVRQVKIIVGKKLINSGCCLITLLDIYSNIQVPRTDFYNSEAATMKSLKYRLKKHEVTITVSRLFPLHQQSLKLRVIFIRKLAYNLNIENSLSTFRIEHHFEPCLLFHLKTMCSLVCY